MSMEDGSDVMSLATLLRQLATLTTPAALDACVAKLYQWAREQASVASMRDDLMAMLEVLALDREIFTSDTFSEFCKLQRVLLMKGAATCVCGEYFEHFYRRFISMTPKRQRVALAYVIECLNRCDACVQSFRGRMMCSDAIVDPNSFVMRSIAIHTLHRSHLLGVVPHTFRMSLVRKFKLWEGVMDMEGMASLRWPVLELLVPTEKELSTVDESLRSRIAEYLLAECTLETGGAISEDDKPVAKRLACVWLGLGGEEEEEVEVVRSETAESDPLPPSVDGDVAEVTVDGDAVEKGFDVHPVDVHPVDVRPVDVRPVETRQFSTSTVYPTTLASTYPREYYESGKYVRAAAGAAYVPVDGASHLVRELAPHKHFV